MLRKIILRLLLTLCLVLTLGVHSAAFALNYEWSGQVAGDDAAEFPGFNVSGSADFDVSDSILTITLTNTTSGIAKSFAVFTGITWDITGPGISGQAKKNLLTPLTADVAGGSSLVLPSDPETDLRDEWGYKGGLKTGVTGPYGLGAVGDILNFDGTLAADTFGTSIDGTNAALNGSDFGIVGPNPTLTTGGPYVQDSVIFTLMINDTNLFNDVNQIGFVQPLFGTNGTNLVPEPGSLLLLATGLFGMGIFGRKKIKGGMK